MPFVAPMHVILTRCRLISTVRRVIVPGESQRWPRYRADAPIPASQPSSTRPLGCSSHSDTRSSSRHRHGSNRRSKCGRPPSMPNCRSCSLSSMRYWVTKRDGSWSSVATNFRVSTRRPSPSCTPNGTNWPASGPSGSTSTTLCCRPHGHYRRFLTVSTSRTSRRPRSCSRPSVRFSPPICSARRPPWFQRASPTDCRSACKSRPGAIVIWCVSTWHRRSTQCWAFPLPSIRPGDYGRFPDRA